MMSTAMGAAVTELWFAERDLVIGYRDRTLYKTNPASVDEPAVDLV